MMASAADMLTSAVEDAESAWDPKRYRKLLRRCMAATPEDAPTKWAKPPRRPRMTRRQAIVVASVKLIAFMGLVRWLGYYDWAPQLWVDAAFVVVAAPIIADAVTRARRWYLLRQVGAGMAPRADGRMRRRPAARPTTRNF